jgi:multiple sugar transport system substrate-binding protein/putative spermidine/putrescine transport system substrate-binding protein
MRPYHRLLLATAICATFATPTLSAEPVGGGAFNVSAAVDLAALNRDNFQAVVEPAAKGETGHELVFYDFADTLCELLAKESAAFTEQTGIPVKHVCVDGDAATQQLIAAKTANTPAPADLYFGPNNSMRTLTEGGIVANIPLVDLLPNAADLDETAARATRGFSHGGTVLPFHRNQTVLAYDSEEVKDVPQTLQAVFDYARANNVKVAVTTPTEGGSGSGFIESAMLALSPDCKDDLYNFSLTEEEAKAVMEKCMAPVVAFFREQKPLIEFTNGNEASIQALVNDVAAIATVWEDDLYSLANKGLVPKTVRPTLLETGQVGDGDGLFIVASTPALEAALLFANYLLSDAVQIDKMELTGSRTARTTLVSSGKIPENLAQFLVPDDMYHARTRARINGLISSAAADYFVEQVIAQ